ncbi:bifunctional pyr operon transcriptional regulator/uracil phosphoribosyltransferase PyrR [Puniceicoccus vermicola]|uniref:Bifunctional pyr operon transcriptional regulator/uracil phosphoribosyltransferase PyrR n=1 Tax=Puniceicoccus vermicola TaxID=388746 RepID=A0A7X1E5W2_9BACT|nr:bifunctional pyr operon transcriptional regulator/uracil phosphoribosyltransferase PyrR [Puniceicoccus vermicola]MBC2604055.1 bifunctional pyr operon transcriptional regulator/uracil phosphoribosyltransferase PyrR [Puniceicoccus vermicola]
MESNAPDVEPSPENVFRGEEVFSLISTLADRIIESGEVDRDTVILSIANGGIDLGNLLRRLLEKQTGIALGYGIVETSFHRDDIGSRPIPIVAHPTDIPVNIDGKTLIIVDDVIASGRTIRAAINEIFDLGRPAKILLAVLLDRGGRKLPFQPDFLADTITVPQDRILKVHIDEEDPIGHQIQLLPR